MMKALCLSTAVVLGAASEANGLFMLWAERFAVDVPAKLVALRCRLEARPAVQAALQAEGLRLPE